VSKPHIGRWPYFPTWRQAFRDSTLARRRFYRDNAVLVFLAGANVLPRETFITMRGRPDGGGSQTLRTLQTRALCANFNLRYAHTPIVSVEHATGPDDARKWEQTFNLGYDAPLADDLGLPIVPLRRFVRHPSSWRKPCVIAVRKLDPYLEINPSVLGLVRDAARSAFSPTVAHQPGSLSAAVHVRRGDVSILSARRYTANSDILRGIERIRAVAGSRPLTITIYSQGSPDDFVGLAAPDVSLRLNGDAVDDVCSMASADILLVAKRSAFSFLAAYYNSAGTILYEPPGFMPQKGWVPI
jgi:hypothetical protein